VSVRSEGRPLTKFVWPHNPELWPGEPMEAVIRMAHENMEAAIRHVEQIALTSQLIVKDSEGMGAGQ
jgi:hypothetical protein